MPEIKSVQITTTDSKHQTVTLTTGRWGTVVLTIAISGTSWTLTVNQDGVQKATTTLSSPTNASVQSWCRTAMENVFTTNTILEMRFRLHVLVVNPLSVSAGLFTLDVTPDVTKWP